MSAYRSASSADFAWVGAIRKEGADDDFYSLDNLNDALTYTNFADGTDFTSTEGECVVIDEGGVWFTRPCLQQVSALLCQRDKGEQVYIMSYLA